MLTASAQVTLTHVPSLDEIKAVIERVSTLTARANTLRIRNHLVQLLYVYACVCIAVVFVDEQCTLYVNKKLLLLHDSGMPLDADCERIVCITAMLQIDVC